MVTRPFTDLLSKVLPNVPGCPQPLAVEHVRDAAIRVCESTLAWRYVNPQVVISPGVFEYPYAKPAGTDVHVLFGAHMNGYPLEVLTLEQALMAYPAWADLFGGLDPAEVWTTVPPAGFNDNGYNESEFNGSVGTAIVMPELPDASEPRSITQLTADKYVVLPLPDAVREYKLRLFCALKPSKTAGGMNKAVLDDLEEAVIHASLQTLLVMPNVAWTDRELAAYHAKQALFKKTERRARANLGNMRGTLIATAPRFA